MRSRTVREGSVGLLAILGIALFGAIAVWLKGIRFGESTYEIIADFPDVNGIQVGDPVRYRGLKVGKISRIQPGTNGVDVAIEISSSKLLIPRDVNVKASSSGLIGETFIDIIPQSQLPQDTLGMNPVSKDCDIEQILCDNTRLEGQKGITLDDLLPLTYRFSKLYGDPEFFAQIEGTVKNASVAAAEVASLSRNTSSLVSELKQELATISSVSNNLNNIAENASDELTITAKKYQETAEQVNRLTTTVNDLVAQNQSNLVNTLDNISTTSDRLQTLVTKLDKSLADTDTDKLIANLETLTANAAVASKNLNEISSNFNNPENLVSVQQTLDSARVTFANAQKITSDLEAFTGDPAFLENVKILVNGLSDLVSSTEQLEQEVQTTQEIKPLQKALSAAINSQRSENTESPNSQQ